MKGPSASGHSIVGAGALILFIVFATSGPALAKPLSDQQWRKQVKAICTQFHTDRLVVLPESGLAVTELEDAQQYVDQAVPLYEELITSIDSLREPKARAKNVKSFVSALTAAIATITDTPLAAFSAFEDHFAKANSAGKKLSRSCGGLGDQRL